MSGFFSLESPIYRFMSRLLDMLKLNVLWLLCSGVAGMFVLQVFLTASGLDILYPLSYLPLVMLGAATTAAFTLTLRMVDEQEGYILKAYLKAFRENLKKGTVIGIIFLVAAYAIWLDFQFYKAAEQMGESSMGYLILGIVAFLMAFLHLIYAFPLQARYENTVFHTLRNSYAIAVKFFFRSILLFVVTAFLTAFFLWNNVTLLLGILIGPATVMLAISGFAAQSFRLIENQNREQEDAAEERQE